MSIFSQADSTPTQGTVCPQWCEGHDESDAPGIVHFADLGAGVSITIASDEETPTIVSRYADFPAEGARDLAATLTKAAILANGSS